MDYSMHYNKLVETRKNRVKEEGVYYERPTRKKRSNEKMAF